MFYQTLISIQFFIVLFFNSCYANKNNPKDTFLLDSAIAQILSYPELKKANIYIDSFSQGKHGIAYIINYIHRDKPCYAVSFGYNGEDRFETYYLFYIYIHKDSFEIKVNDPLSNNDDGISSVEEWRKNLKKLKH